MIDDFYGKLAPGHGLNPVSTPSQLGRGHGFIGECCEGPEQNIEIFSPVVNMAREHGPFRVMTCRLKMMSSP